MLNNLVQSIPWKLKVAAAAAAGKQSTQKMYHEYDELQNYNKKLKNKKTLFIAVPGVLQEY